MPTTSARPLADLLAAHPLLARAWPAAHEAARYLRDDRPTDLHVDTKSTRSDAVTEMDRGAEAIIVERVLAGGADDGFLGEEGGERPGTSGVRWVVDPLDGTVNYLYRLPMWGVSIAAEQDGEVVVGVVVLPAMDEAYVAIRGGGAWLVRGDEAVPLAVRGTGRLDDALVSTGFAYAPERRIAHAAVVSGLIGEVRDIRRTGCAVVDLCWLAHGRLDAHFERLNVWDFSAAALVATEAGATATGLHTDDLSEYVVVAVPGIHATLRARLLELV